MDYYDEIHSDEMHERNTQQPIVITATTARELTENKLKSIREKEIINIFEEIYDAIEDGSYDVVISGIISDETTKKLQELGYKVEEEIWIAERNSRISWGDEDNGIQ